MEEEGYLKDVLNGTYEEKQFRCNQVFVLALPFQMVSQKQGQRILQAVKEKAVYDSRTAVIGDGGSGISSMDRRKPAGA